MHINAIKIRWVFQNGPPAIASNAGLDEHKKADLSNRTEFVIVW